MAPLTLLAANCHQTLLRSTIVDWYPDPNHGNIVAVGHRSGTVTITGVDTTIQLGAGLSNRREFSPRVNRPCSQIAWNPVSLQTYAREGRGCEARRGEGRGKGPAMQPARGEPGKFRRVLPRARVYHSLRGKITLTGPHACLTRFPRTPDLQLKPTVIAVGLDRLNKEPSLLLWDVSAKAVSLGDMKRRLPGASGDGLRNLKPYTSSGPARTAGPTEMSVGEGARTPCHSKEIQFLPLFSFLLFFGLMAGLGGLSSSAELLALIWSQVCFRSNGFLGRKIYCWPGEPIRPTRTTHNAHACARAGSLVHAAATVVWSAC